MTTELISAEVRQFVFDHIDSVSEHEALLLLRKFAARKVDARRSMSDDCPSAAKQLRLLALAVLSALFWLWRGG